MLAAFVACAAIALLAMSAERAAAAEVSGGSLNWGIKESFVSYVRNVPPAGTVTPSNGATEADDAGFDWSDGSGEIESDGTAGSLAFTGTVTFSKPAHGINIVVEDPRIEWSGDTGTLFATGTSQGNAYDVPMLDLDFSAVTPAVDGEAIALTDVPSTITEEGAPVFGGTYPAGTEFDPVSFVVEAAAEPTETITLKPGKAKQKAASGEVKLGKVSCTAGCTVKAPKKIKGTVKSTGQTVKLKVKKVKPLAAGEKATVIAKVNGKAKKALAGSQAKFETTIKVKSGAEKVEETVSVKVTG